MMIDLMKSINVKSGECKKFCNNVFDSSKALAQLVAHEGL